MKLSPRWSFALLLTGCAALSVMLAGVTSRTEALPRPPRLAGLTRPHLRLLVVIVFDQLRGDYLERWKDLYGEGGFRRLMKDGAWFQNCHYPFAGTWTGAGHASIATGAYPNVHGIVGNEWYDRASGNVVNCVRSTKVRPVTMSSDRSTIPGQESAPSASPQNLLSPTLADALKRHTHGRGKVVALSMKDRSAVLPGGERPDACYWMEDSTGDFITSTHYRSDLHGWVAQFNASKAAHRWVGKQWDKVPGLDHEKYSGPDDVEGEDGLGASKRRTFPHPLGEAGKPVKDNITALLGSPFGNDVLLALAQKAVLAEGLGADDVPDLLSVSFSANDLIGHVWGPDSQEVLDATVRTDRTVRALLDFLDLHVGADHYALALTSDHGVCPLPQSTQRKGSQGGWHRADELQAIANRYLREHYGETEMDCVEKVSYYDFYLNRSWLKARNLSAAEVQQVLADWLKKDRIVETAFTATELERPEARKDRLGELARRSHYPERSGDVFVVLKPYHIVWSRKAGTTHGSPHEYDTHVPLVFLGPGIKAGPRKEAVMPMHAASVLAAYLGIAPPAHCEASVPTDLIDRP